MNTTTPQTPNRNHTNRSEGTPRYLERYAADVDRWHLNARLARSSSR